MAASRKMPRTRRDKHLSESLDDFLSPARRESPNFYYKVYGIVEQIPKGKVTTYGAIAEALGMKRSARMVGQALNAVPEDSGIPAQRVINRIGALSGAHHFGGYERMREMLVREGVTFKGELVDMEKHFWNPKLP
jgi:methylated-DNA-protein-cysteine methyltransferase-like protein